MALPTTIVSSVVGLWGHHPPFKSSAGNFYVVAQTSTGSIDVYKATDPTDSWALQDDGNSPGSLGNLVGYSVTQKGDVLYIASARDIGYYFYSEFDMSANTWSVANQTIELVANDPTFPWISIAVRSDGDVVVVYAGSTDAEMGNDKERVDYNVRTGTTWGGPVALDAGGDTHYGNPNCVLGTNDFVHVIWQRTTETANDPPTSWTGSQGASVDSSDDSLSSVDNNTSDTAGILLGLSNLVTYDDSGTQRVLVNGHVGGDLLTLRGEEDTGGPPEDLVFEGFGRLEAFTAEGYINGEVGISTYVALGVDIHSLYSGGGTAGVNQDLYYTKSDDNGINWDTETEEIDTITVNYVSATIYVRGSDTVTGCSYV